MSMYLFVLLLTKPGRIKMKIYTQINIHILKILHFRIQDILSHFNETKRKAQKWYGRQPLHTKTLEMLHISILAIDLSLGKRVHVRHTVKACTPQLNLFISFSRDIHYTEDGAYDSTMILAYYTNIHVFISTM